MKKISLLLASLSSVFAIFASGCSSECSHEYGTWKITVPAGCETEGEQSRTCSKCGKIDKKIINPLGHNFVNGVCTVCGKTQANNNVLFDEHWNNKNIQIDSRIYVTSYRDE